MPELIGKLTRYLFAGGTAALVDIGGFGLLRFVSELPVTSAAACSFLLATTVNFVLSARWVFAVPVSRRRLAMFLIGALGGLCVNVAVTVAGMSYLKLSWAISKMLGIGTAFLINFWINSAVVFRTGADRKHHVAVDGI